MHGWECRRECVNDHSDVFCHQYRARQFFCILCIELPPRDHTIVRYSSRTMPVRVRNTRNLFDWIKPRVVHVQWTPEDTTRIHIDEMPHRKVDVIDVHSAWSCRFCCWYFCIFLFIFLCLQKKRGERKFLPFPFSRRFSPQSHSRRPNRKPDKDHVIRRLAFDFVAVWELFIYCPFV